MGDEAEHRAERMSVTPGEDDGLVTLRATELVGRELVSTEDGTRAVAREDGDFVVVEFPDRGRFHRFTIRGDAWIRIHRAVPHGG